jgi:hypothetical protein
LVTGSTIFQTWLSASHASGDLIHVHLLITSALFAALLVGSASLDAVPGLCSPWPPPG